VKDVLTAGILIFILISTISLIVLMDIVQGHDLFEAWFSLSKLLRVAKGEDYFLILICFIILVLLILTHIRERK
jgi:ABC-type Fe3+-siderophore transport system permease subunit